MRLQYLNFIVLFLIGTGLHAEELKPLLRFNFKANSSKILPGNSTEKGTAHNCQGIINAEDQAQDFAIVAIFNQNSCYTDPRWSNLSYRVETGMATSRDGKVSYPAVRVHPSAKKATAFLASKHIAYYRSSQATEVFELSGDELIKSYRTTQEMAIDDFQRVENFYVDDISRPSVFVFIPGKENFSAYQQIAPNVSAAQLFSGKNFTVERYRFDVPGAIFDTMNGFNPSLISAETRYGRSRSFFLQKQRKGFSVVWQDQNNDDIFLSIIADDLKSIETKKMKSLKGSALAAATSDDEGNVYYILIERSKDYYTFDTMRASSFKADSNGNSILSKKINTDQKGFNIANFAAGAGQTEFSSASLVFKNGFLALTLGRTMHKSPDGLNHQGAIIVVFNAHDFSIVKNHGQASGHSLGNVTVPASDNNFWAIDLGDNYPRGVSLYRFNEAAINRRLLYTTKVHHGETARTINGQATPVYTEISRGNKTFYKWSNDNTPYSELGGVNETKDGVLVFFTGEPDANGKSLNNERALNVLNDARNLGFIYLQKDFTKPDAILSHGVTEKGGFYTFGGTYSEQENKGIKWLTNFRNLNKQNVSRVKTISLDNNRVLLLYEIWTKDNYTSTQLNVFDPTKGSIVISENIGGAMRLGWRDDLLQKDSQIFAPTGNITDGKLEINIIKFKR